MTPSDNPLPNDVSLDALHPPGSVRSAFVAAELDPVETDVVRAHLAICTRCRDLVESERRLAAGETPTIPFLLVGGRPCWLLRRHPLHGPQDYFAVEELSQTEFKKYVDWARVHAPDALIELHAGDTEVVASVANMEDVAMPGTNGSALGLVAADRDEAPRPFLVQAPSGLEFAKDARAGWLLVRATRRT